MTTQQDCSIGLSPAEASYGAITTVDRWFLFTDESFDWKPEFVQGEGLKVGTRGPLASRRPVLPAKQSVEGDLTIEACPKGLGRILQAALGTSTSNLVSGSLYQQNHTPATTDPLNSYTIQKGVPPVGGGATHAYTFTGCMCDGLSFDFPNGDIVKITSKWMGKDVTTATAYAAPSYPTLLYPWTFADGAITIGGSVTAPTTTALATGGTVVANIRDGKLDYANNLDGEGFNLGGGGKRGRKQMLGRWEISGSLTAEYDSTTFRDAFLNQSDLGLVVTFTGPSQGGVVPVLQLYVADIRITEGGIPQAAGGDVITQSLNFVGLDNGTVTPLYVVLRTSDTAI